MPLSDFALSRCGTASLSLLSLELLRAILGRLWVLGFGISEEIT
jgi:hypothetical protein